MYQICGSLSPFQLSQPSLKKGWEFYGISGSLGRESTGAVSRLALHARGERVEPCVTSCEGGRPRAAGVQLSLPDGQIRGRLRVSGLPGGGGEPGARSTECGADTCFGIPAVPWDSHSLPVRVTRLNLCAVLRTAAALATAVSPCVVSPLHTLYRDTPAAPGLPLTLANWWH